MVFFLTNESLVHPTIDENEALASRFVSARA